MRWWLSRVHGEDEGRKVALGSPCVLREQEDILIRHVVFGGWPRLMLEIDLSSDWGNPVPGVKEQARGEVKGQGMGLVA